MQTAKSTPAPDTRSASQKAADENAAAGNWEGFETTELLTEESAALLWKLRQNSGSLLGALQSQPFRWRERVFRIVQCEYHDGAPIVEVAPADPELVAEIKRRVEKDPFHTLNYFQGFGFICFPEDYVKYQN